MSNHAFWEPEHDIDPFVPFFTDDFDERLFAEPPVSEYDTPVRGVEVYYPDNVVHLEAEEAWSPGVSEDGE